MYIALIDVLIYSAGQLQECSINLLTYLLTQKRQKLKNRKWLSQTQ